VSQLVLEAIFVVLAIVSHVVFPHATRHSLDAVEQSLVAFQVLGVAVLAFPFPEGTFPMLKGRHRALRHRIGVIGFVVVVHPVDF